MKSKFIIGIALFLIVVLSNVGCSARIGEAQYIKEVYELASKIDLPIKYCPRHGSKYEYGEIKIELVGYDYRTGEPFFNITRKKWCSTANWFERFFINRTLIEERVTYLRCQNKGEVLFHIDITLDELKNSLLWWM